MRTNTSTIHRLIVPALLLLLLMAGVVAAAQTQIQVGRTAESAAHLEQSGLVYVPVAVGRPAFTMTPIGEGFHLVTEVTHAGDARLFVVEQAGVIKILHPDGHISVFLDIQNQVISHRGEYGLFDLAFHPGYNDPASPGYGLFFVSYTDGFDDGVVLDVDFKISRFRVSADPDVANPASQTLIIKEKQSFDVHKGGGMEFDPANDMLYVGMGDDRLLLIAQSDRSPKGKIFRLEVNKVPPDLVGDGRGYLADEIWAFGLRNPWKFDLDAASGQIFVGDVGDQLWEEINIVPLGVRGFNYGWPCMEGPFVIPEANDIPQCDHIGNFHRAIHEYAHRDGSGRCAVIAGKINRPYYNPNDGRFIFGDMCTREIFALRHNGVAWERTLLGILPGDLITSIGEGVDGVQYVGTVARPGPIYRLYIP